MSELNYASALAALDGEFESASAQTGGSGVPAGRYNAILKEAKIVARTGGGIALSVSFIVTEGPYKGRYAFTSYGLSKNGLPFFKGFLQMIQLPLTKLSELEKALPLFPGHMCVIDVRRPQEPAVHHDLCGPVSGHGQCGRLPQAPGTARRAG